MVMRIHIREEEEEEVEKAEGQGEGKVEVDIEVEITEEVVLVVVEGMGMVYGFLIEKIEVKMDHKQADENGMSVLQYVLCLLYSVMLCVYSLCAFLFHKVIRHSITSATFYLTTCTNGK